MRNLSDNVLVKILWPIFKPDNVSNAINSFFSKIRYFLVIAIQSQILFKKFQAPRNRTKKTVSSSLSNFLIHMYFSLLVANRKRDCCGY